jgi:membrane associated rhomboid family serine protease
MNEAAVGFQCPECLAEGAARTRDVRTVLGARVDARTGLVSYTLVAIIIGVAALGFLLNAVGGPDLRTTLGVVGIAIDVTDSGPTLIGVADGEYYRLFTAQFVHGGLLHLLFNCYVLFVIGPFVESAIGRWRFLALFLISGITGAVASYLFNDPQTLSVGASGAIFGLFGAALVINHRLGRRTNEILGLLAINLVLGFVIPNIDWRAHLGGLIAGSLVAAVLAFSAPRLRQAAFVVVCLVILAIDALLVAARTSELRDLSDPSNRQAAASAQPAAATGTPHA